MQQEKQTKEESKLIPGAEPFFFPGGQVGCLLIHGFTSTPYDVRACAEYLAERGITAKGVLVAGHGTTPKDLAKTNLSDWLDSIRIAYKELKQTCPFVFGLGISLAGNFLTILAQELKFDGLIFVGMPVEFRHKKSYTALYYLFRSFGVKYQRKWYQKSLSEEIKKVRPNYKAIPLASGKEVLKTIEMSKKMLPGIHCPLLVIQSTTDHAVTEKNIKEITSSVGTSNVSVIWVDDKYHVVLIDDDKEKVFEDIYSFITERTPKK